MTRRRPPKADDTDPAALDLLARLLALEVDARELQKKARAHYGAAADIVAHVERHTKATSALVSELQPRPRHSAEGAANESS